MRKLVVGLFVLGAAVATQAAYVDWKLDYTITDAATISDWGTSGATGYTAYLLTADAYDNLAKTDGKINAIADVVTAAGANKAALNYNKAGKSGKQLYTTGDQQATVGATDSNFYIILSDGNQYNVAVANASATPYADATGMGTGLTPNLTLSGITTAPSYTTFAPEPTSGLLMLVGFGALALRRRRA